MQQSHRQPGFTASEQRRGVRSKPKGRDAQRRQARQQRTDRRVFESRTTQHREVPQS